MSVCVIISHRSECICHILAMITVAINTGTTSVNTANCFAPIGVQSIAICMSIGLHISVVNCY